MEPWNFDKPDLTRVGVEVAAQKLQAVLAVQYGDVIEPYKGFEVEWQEDVAPIIRAYLRASGQ